MSSMSSAGNDELALAVGRVTMLSAINDEYLRRIIQEVVGLGNSAWILIEGQSSEWLFQTMPVVLHEEDSSYQVWPKPQHDALLNAVASLKLLQVHRNSIVHGTWESGVSSTDEDEQPVARPWGDRDEDMEWFCFRSRQRTYKPYMRWTISDIELLSDKLIFAGERLMQSYAAMLKHRSSNLFRDSFWSTWGDDPDAEGAEVRGAK